MPLKVREVIRKIEEAAGDYCAPEVTTVFTGVQMDVRPLSPAGLETTCARGLTSYPEANWN